MSSYLLLILVCLFTCAGQLCQKQAVECWHNSPLTKRLSATLRWLALACALLGFGMLVWLNVLQQLPLSLAYPFLSLNFIFITLAAYFFFGEKASLRHWIGVFFIMLGILLLGIQS